MFSKTLYACILFANCIIESLFTFMRERKRKRNATLNYIFHRYLHRVVCGNNHKNWIRNMD